MSNDTEVYLILAVILLVCLIVGLIFLTIQGILGIIEWTNPPESLVQIFWWWVGLRLVVAFLGGVIIKALAEK